MNDRGLMLGFELWWVFAFDKHFGSRRNHAEIVQEVCGRWHIERSEALHNRKRVDSLLAPELTACGGDLFALIGRILSFTKTPAEGGEPVIEVDLDSGAVTDLGGWEDATKKPLEKCGIDEHPAWVLKTIINAMNDQLPLLRSQRQALDEQIATLESKVEEFRGRGRPRRD